VDEKVYIGGYPVVDGEIEEYDPSNPYLWIKAYINSVIPEGTTATAPALWEAYDYFKQSNDHDYKEGFPLADDSHLYRDPHYLCNEDGSNCQPLPCTSDFVILLSDGQWNVGGKELEETCSIDTGFASSNSEPNYSADPVVPAYLMHTQELRDLNGHSIKVSAVYTVSMFMNEPSGEPSGKLSLQNVAMYGSFDTTHRSWPDSLSGYPQKTCGDGCKGSLCTPLPPSSPDWDANGDDIPDTFFTASNACFLKKVSFKQLMT